ncbi:MAG: UDP-N-acetylmuramate--L-alanine ligase [Deltaproteobacteria bacterium]|nr:UDP-N-acetylmuramate--L-alanine ligase [Deltaproteobacteria bacterium]
MGLTLRELAGKRVHLLGIGGIGVSALARLLLPHGVAVSGCDVRESVLIDALRAEGVTVDIGHDPSHLDRCDVVVYSTAVPKNNPELAAAIERGMPVLHRSELLALLVGARDAVGITGTNGKGTVSAMLTWILESAGMSPGFYIGALCPNLGTNARPGTGRHLVAELDESDGSLVNIHPRRALLNNLELDHLNYYSSLEHAVETLTRFFNGLPEGSTGFFNVDDPGVRKVMERLEGLSMVTFGRNSEADYVYRELLLTDTHSRFAVSKNGPGGRAELGEFDLNVPGAYNIENAAGAIAVACEAGVPVEAMRRALASFQGLVNRYTVLEAGPHRVIKDYMSHPMGMRKVLATAALGNPQRLVAVFKPYRYTMIRYHATNYAEALSSADEVVVTRMWEADEEPIPGVDTLWLVDELRKAGLDVSYVEEMAPIVDHVLARASQRDCVVFFGGNDLFEIAQRLHEKYEEMGDVEGE